MITLWGISGDAWSLMVQLLGLAASLLLGILGRRRGLLAFAIAIGLLVNIVGQIVLAGGGPGACAGMVGLPLVCIGAAYTGTGLRWLFWDRKKPAFTCESCGATLEDASSTNCPACHQPLRCAHCGYNLTGNVSGICPECGQKI